MCVVSVSLSLFLLKRDQSCSSYSVKLFQLFVCYKEYYVPRTLQNKNKKTKKENFNIHKPNPIEMSIVLPFEPRWEWNLCKEQRNLHFELSVNYVNFCQLWSTDATFDWNLPARHSLCFHCILYEMLLLLIDYLCWTKFFDS